MSADLTIIIPTLNEEKFISRLLGHIELQAKNPSKLEIIVVDGGSKDSTVLLAKKAGAKTVNSEKGRPKQLNLGAKKAAGQILYFLHADTFPPKNFDEIILNATTSGFESGCFRMKFDTKNPILKLFAWLTRFNHILCRGGDQSLYITKRKFEALGGFNENYLIYEDSELISRIYKHTEFKIHPQHVITSARKHNEIGWFRVQFHFAIIHLKNYLGTGPEELALYYSRHLIKKKKAV